MSARGSPVSLTQPPHAELAAAPAFRVVDITDEVEDAVRAAGVTDGLACVYSPATGSVVRVHELESGLLEDFARLLERLVPGRRPRTARVADRDADRAGRRGRAGLRRPRSRSASGSGCC